MAKSTWGDPVVGIRMPRPVIKAAKRMAWNENMTFSSLVRELLTKELLEKGYSITDEPADGQISFDDE